MQVSSLLRTVFIWWLVCQQTRSFTITRNKEYRGSGEVVSGKDAVNNEPTCEELKAMWRFSKRQSRAAEITNEIPTYRDPFAYNVWEPYYARSRSMGGLRVGNRYRGRPVYGRVIHKPPMLRIQDVAERNRAFEEVARMYGNVQKTTEPRRRVTAFRLSGGAHLPLTPQSGSFQHLKELIRTERARELQEQRLAEEAEARSDALKELANGIQKANFHEFNYDLEDEEGREDPEAMNNRKSILAFPDLLAPAARFGPDQARFVEDYNYYRPRTHRSMLHSENLDDLDGLLI
ncbi:PREDICTED: uncharacterized protein LOC108557326 isoform X2 [Nicrophorus vespilloides]|uniref:Uncharacterized protein LOC108557326 isoform X2 n=1 Tax=Nicrophorus vespilloides TaxID=110193 RepID=A0ABM1M3Y9_NICVS|nr:PREDICTED: uncharacterized protein LOC108557326 isoform X2 [Nicrophorus vespilloides]